MKYSVLLNMIIFGIGVILGIGIMALGIVYHSVLDIFLGGMIFDGALQLATKL